MNQKEISACLGWHIRSGKGFYYKGKKYNSIGFYKDEMEIYMNDYEYWETIKYSDIEKIENVVVDSKLQKTIFTR